MRTIAMYFALATLTACAAAGPNARQDRTERVIVSGDAGTMADVNLRREDYVPSEVLDAPRETVWALLPAAYNDVGLPEPVADQSTWTVAVVGHRAMRRIGDTRMSAMISCGSDIAGQHADTHRIRLSVQTWLEESDGGTNARTRLEATASSIEGRAGVIACTSTGELENRITEMLSVHLATH